MIGLIGLRSGMGGGAATRILTHDGVTVTFRRLRSHEADDAPEGHRAIVAVANTPFGIEEQRWHVPRRDVKQALNRRCTSYGRALAAGCVPSGWRIA